MAPLILAALGLLLVPAFAAPPSCVDKVDEGTTYVATNYLWDIQCDIDYWGNDLLASQQPTFEACIIACDAHTECVDVSYVGDNCYMKSALAANAEPQGNCWTAKRGAKVEVPEEILPLSCFDKKDDGKKYRTIDSVWNIVCGIDYAGNDLTPTNTATFEDCIQACREVTACVDVSFVWGTCYMKSALGDPIERGHVWSAVLEYKAPAPVNPEEPEEPEEPAEPEEPTPTAPLTNPTCENKKDDKKQFGSPSGGLYLIECGVDYAGGDLDATVTESFEDCITACDKNSLCVDVSYVWGSCYLKSQLNDAVAVGHVWSAKVLKPAKDIFAFPTATPQDVGDGTETIMELPIEMEPAPTATLAPVSPPGINMGGLGVLTPDTTAKIWYNGDDAENEEGGATTVRLSIDYEYPSIVLDYSMYIKDVVCTADGLTGRFDTAETITPYLYAISTWPQDSKVILITAAASCSPGEGQNGLFLAETVVFDDATKTFKASGALADIAQLYTKMDIDFGTIIADVPIEPEFDGTAPCGNPSQTVLNGLPALACGPDFDKRLDELLTFYSDEIEDPVAILAAASPPETGLSTHVVEKRFFGFIVNAVKSVVKAVVQTVVNVAKAVVNTVTEIVVKAAILVVNVAKKVVAVSVAIATHYVKLLVFVVTGSYSNKLTLPVNMRPGSSMKSESPWGDTVKFYTFKRGPNDEKFDMEALQLEKVKGLIGIEEDPEPGVEMWCVNCGVTGKIVAEGSITATPLSGLTKGQIKISGNMYAGLYLGVNAFAKWEKTFEKDLIKAGLPGWSIPGIVTLGPQLILGIEATIGVEAQGQLLTGASLTWPAFEATLDFVDRRRSTRSGWTPVVDSKFQAHGSLEATAALGLPITVEFGLDILNGAFKQSIGLKDVPAIQATAEFSIDIGTEGNDIGTDSCYGVGWDIKLTNELTLQLTNVAEWKLHEWASPALAEGCIGWPKPDEEPEEPEEPEIPDIPDVPEPVDTSLKCPAAQGTTYTDVTNNNWEIRCDIDYPAYDMGSNNSPDFDSCIASCGRTTGCVGVSWLRVGPTPAMAAQGSASCYLKSAWGPRRPIFAPFIGSPVDTALMMSPFRIHSVIYSDRDVTAQAAARFVSGNRLIVNTNILATLTGDPWPGQPKSLSMLYSYGAEERIFNARDGWGTLVIPAGPVDAAPYSSIVPNYPQAWGCYWLQIVGINYGQISVNNIGVSNNLYWHSANNRNWQFTNSLMGGDPWVGQPKTGVIWYRDTYSAPGNGRGDLYVMTARENNYGGWWRPWGKRSVEWSKPTLTGRQEGNYNASRAALLSNGTYSNTTVTPSAVPSATPVPLFSNNTVISNSTLPTLNNTTPVAAPSATPIPIFSNLTTPASKLTRPAAAAPFGNTTLPANITAPLFPLLNATVPTNSTGTNTTLPVALPTLPDPTFEEVTILDSTAILKLNPGTNGNLFLSDPSDSTDISTLTSATFIAAKSDDTIAVIGDSSNRLLHYYPATMASQGASRVRLAGLEEIPKGAKLVSLVQFTGVSGEKMLMGLDSSGEYFFLMLCAIQGQLNKVFLVKDVDAAPAILQTEDAKFTLTGGLASDCVPLAMVAQL